MLTCWVPLFHILLAACSDSVAILNYFNYNFFVSFDCLKNASNIIALRPIVSLSVIGLRMEPSHSFPLQHCIMGSIHWNSWQVTWPVWCFTHFHWLVTSSSSFLRFTIQMALPQPFCIVTQPMKMLLHREMLSTSICFVLMEHMWAL